MTARARDLSPEAAERLARNMELIAERSGFNAADWERGAATLRALAAENERLRAVLSPLVNHPLFHDREYLSRELNEKLDAARAALPEGDEP